jgi:hypothetical protein
VTQTKQLPASPARFRKLLCHDQWSGYRRVTQTKQPPANPARFRGNILSGRAISLGRRKFYTRIIVALIFGFLAKSIATFMGAPIGPQPRPMVDFDVFYVAGSAVLEGRAADIYDLAGMAAAQDRLYSDKHRFLWAYPPQMDLLVGPLALLPLGLAYAVAVGGSLCGYLLALRRLAAGNLLTILLLMAFPITCTIITGQNGFVTGTLIALTCIGFLSGRSWAGVPLGLMIIKPHLAIGFALFALFGRRWSVVVVAAATVLGSTVLATLIFGLQIWPAFLGGLKQSSSFLEQGRYPLYRMVSTYSTMRSLSAPASVALVLSPRAVSASARRSASPRSPQF